MSCFAIALELPENYFRLAMDVTKPDCLTQLRMLHYPASENSAGTWRAGVHTDIGCLTLLFQRTGEDGLEICPGRESHTSYAVDGTFTPLKAETGPIVVNIGDMLSMFTNSAHFLVLQSNENCSGLVWWQTQGQLSQSSRKRCWEIRGSLLHCVFQHWEKGLCATGPQKEVVS